MARKSTFALTYRPTTMSIVKRLFYETQWNIGWRTINKENLSDFEQLRKALSDVRFLRKGTFYFLADPFIIDAKDKILVAEYFHFFKGFGELVLLQFDDEGQIRWMRKVASKSAHYSYPFVYKRKGGTFIFPESSMDNCQKCLQMEDLSGKVKETIILSDTSVVDGTLLEIEGCYLFFANPSENFNDELWIYRSVNLEGPWKCIQKIKGKNLRGAGKFIEIKGKVYRPSQKNEIIYGGGIVLNEVLDLKEGSYTEKEAYWILPAFLDNKKNVSGTHTLNVEDNLLVTDVRYERFVWWKPLAKTFVKMRMLLRK